MSDAKRATAPKSVKTKATMTPEELEIAELTSKLKALKEKAKNTPRLKVSVKGAVTLFGVRKHPVTFLASEWKAIFAEKDRVEAFIEDNKETLK